MSTDFSRLFLSSCFRTRRLKSVLRTQPTKVGTLNAILTIIRRHQFWDSPSAFLTAPCQLPARRLNNELASDLGSARVIKDVLADTEREFLLSPLTSTHRLDPREGLRGLTGTNSLDYEGYILPSLILGP